MTIDNINTTDLTPYENLIEGGMCYYTQNKPGTQWVDKVDNNKGWTIDFGLKVRNINDSEVVLSENQNDGIGIYVNDGKKKEVINFFEQEILFKNDDRSVVYDTTGFNDYRVIGHKDSIKLYAKDSEEENYSLLIDGHLKESSRIGQNALNPSVFQDEEGNVFVVWFDDSLYEGSILYSKKDNNGWSNIEVIATQVGTYSDSDIVVNQDGYIFIAYTTSYGTPNSSIEIVYNNKLGWSNPYLIGNSDGYSLNPSLTLLADGDIACVWDDDRSHLFQIFMKKFDVSTLEWSEEIKITSSINGSVNSSVISHTNDIFISYTEKLLDGKSQIKIEKYNLADLSKVAERTVVNNGGFADNSHIGVNVSGKICVSWHDNVTGKYEIYASILTSNLDYLITPSMLTDSSEENNNDFKFPMVAENIDTHDMYIVFRDEGHIYASVYNHLDNLFESSNSYYSNIKFNFEKEKSINNFSISPIFNNNYEMNYDEMFIVYESREIGDYNEKFLKSDKLFSNIKYFTYDGDTSLNDIAIEDENDYFISNVEDRKEIRFGDFSSTINGHLIFTYFRYYIDNAVEPFVIKNVNSKNTPFDNFSGKDIAVNNYGDVWIVGKDGIFCYINKYNGVYSVEKDENLEDIGIDTSIKDFSTIAFDTRNYIYLGGKNGIYCSSNHLKNYYKIYEEEVTSIAFNNDRIYIGTPNGLKIYLLSYTQDIVNISEEDEIIIDSLPIFNVSSIEIDKNNVIWIGTSNGLYRLYNDNILRYTAKDGLPSNTIYDITVRNSAIRYIATSAGIAKMVGSNFDDIITSGQDNLWSNTVKCVLWENPNVLWAGTQSKINQIIVDDINSQYDTIIYDPVKESEVFDLVENRDLQVYYIDDEEYDISEDDILDVYINGNLVLFGYKEGYDKRIGKKVIKFDCPLKFNDIVEVVVRKDLSLKADFIQTNKEISSVGERLIRIKDIAVTDNNIYISSEGTYNRVKVNDVNTNLPFDKVHLDTTPPRFKNSELDEGYEEREDRPRGINIIEQIDRGKVKVNINDATDGYKGSGIESMIVSNYPNFTVDGENPKDPVPYKTSYIHDMGLSLDENIRRLNIEEGYGSNIVYFSSTEEFFAASSKPAILYKKNGDIWEEKFKYSENAYIDFIAQYNNNLIVSVGYDNNLADIYIYKYVYDESEDFEIKYHDSQKIGESRAHCFSILNNILYIGSGTNNLEGNGTSGKIYRYDGETFTSVIGELGYDIYELTSMPDIEIPDDDSSITKNLFAVVGQDTGGDGQSGFVYEIDVDAPAAFIIHSEQEPLVSAKMAYVNESTSLFIGGMNKGIIKRSPIDINAFNISFQTMPGKVSAIKTFIDSEGEVVLYSCVGPVLYYLSKNNMWIWRYTHIEDINDISFDKTSNSIFIISDNRITEVTSLEQERNIYLSLIDRAGNQTFIDSEKTVDDNPFIDSISISKIKDYVNENRLLEIDSYGNVLFTFGGNNSFYSAEKIEEEKGVYISEVFDGGNSLIKWESLSWQAIRYADTSINVYMRASSSKEDIVRKEWIGPFDNEKSHNIDISFLMGQYVQLKVELISNKKGITPEFHRASIKAVTSEAVHFFTTNFILPSNIKKGILTSEKVIPVSAEIVFGINTTNSIDWSDYQIIDENRVFNITQTGENIRVGIKFITPTSQLTGEGYEYSQYGEDLYFNTIPFNVENNTYDTQKYFFNIIFYADEEMENEIHSISSENSIDGFSIDNQLLSENGVEIEEGEINRVLFTPAGLSGISCDTSYWVKIESYYYQEEEKIIEVIEEGELFILGCSTLFLNKINFNFTNENHITQNYNFKIVIYKNPERTDELSTIYSGNNPEQWTVDGDAFPAEGTDIDALETVDIECNPNWDSIVNFEYGKVYYLIIIAVIESESEEEIISKSYDLRAIEDTDAFYCGDYSNVPIVKNFGIMFELENNQFIKLNLD